MAKKKKMKKTFDCVKCPSYCCTSYAYVQVSHNDMKILAEHLGISIKQFKKKYTDPSELEETPNERQLKKVKDTMQDMACIFLDQKSRLCTVHDYEPDVCRDYNGTTEGNKQVCRYYDLFEYIQERQGKAFVPLVQIEHRKWKKKDRPSL